jgi:hypothetical protein
MHPDIIKFIDKDAPNINMDLAEGLATIHLKGAAEYVDRVFKAASVGFPPGLQYRDWRICTAKEEYDLSVKSRNKGRRPVAKGMQKTTGSKQYETAQTDFFLFEPILYFNDERLTRLTLYIPFAEPGGKITISDGKWYISPVLADRVISIGTDQVFVRLLRDRLTFGRVVHRYKCNGEPASNGVVYSRIYHKSKDRDGKTITQANTTMAHYLFCKFGFEGAMLKYAKAKPVVGIGLDTNTAYPMSEWAIYSSTGIAPTTAGNRRRQADHVASPLQVAIRKDEVNDESNALVAGFFYVVDHFPNLISEQYVNTPDGWIAAMGYMLFSENNNRGNIEKGVHKHLSSLDDYADQMVIDNMRAIGINIENIYDFFAIIARDFGYWISNNQDKVNSMYDKELAVLYFVLFDIIKGIFNLFFALKGNSKKVLTKNDVEKALKDNLKQGFAYAISKTHGEATSLSYSGDNMAFKATATLTPQTHTTRATRKGTDRNVGSDPSKMLHPSVAEVAAISAVTKSDPTGRSRINHYMQLNETRDLIHRNPKFKELLDIIAAGELTTRSVAPGGALDDEVEIIKA